MAQKQFLIDKQYTVWMRAYVTAETAEEAATKYNNGAVDDTRILDDTYEPLNDKEYLLTDDGGEIQLSKLTDKQ